MLFTVQLDILQLQNQYHICFLLLLHKNDSYDSLPTEKILTLQNVTILNQFQIKINIFYYYKIFFRKMFKSIS